MVNIAKMFLEFLIVFLLIYLVSYLLLVRKMKKYDRKKIPTNINYLIVKYNLDVVRIGYESVYKLVTLTDAFIVSLLYIITKFIDIIYLRLIVGFILAFPLFAACYYLIARYYQNRKD